MCPNEGIRKFSPQKTLNEMEVTNLPDKTIQGNGHKDDQQP